MQVETDSVIAGKDDLTQVILLHIVIEQLGDLGLILARLGLVGHCTRLNEGIGQTGGHF